MTMSVFFYVIAVFASVVALFSAGMALYCGYRADAASGFDPLVGR